jgi:hypothetical protein
MAWCDFFRKNFQKNIGMQGKPKRKFLLDPSEKDAGMAPFFNFRYTALGFISTALEPNWYGGRDQTWTGYHMAYSLFFLRLTGIDYSEYLELLEYLDYYDY